MGSTSGVRWSPWRVVFKWPARGFAEPIVVPSRTTRVLCPRWSIDPSLDALRGRGLLRTQAQSGPTGPRWPAKRRWQRPLDELGAGRDAIVGSALSLRVELELFGIPTWRSGADLSR